MFKCRPDLTAYGHSYLDPAFIQAGNQFSEAVTDNLSPIVGVTATVL